MNRVTKALLVLTLSWCAMAVQAAEETIFSSFDGQPRSIESYAGNGKWLVVVIWAHDCSVCNREIASYALFHEERKRKDASVLGVSIDGASHHAEAEDFIKRHDLPFPNLIGEPQPAMLYYMMETKSQFHGTPSILVYNPASELVAAQGGAVPVDVIEGFIARQAAKPGS